MPQADGVALLLVSQLRMLMLRVLRLKAQHQLERLERLLREREPRLNESSRRLEEWGGAHRKPPGLLEQSDLNAACQRLPGLPSSWID